MTDRLNKLWLSRFGHIEFDPGRTIEVQVHSRSSSTVSAMDLPLIAATGRWGSICARLPLHLSFPAARSCCRLGSNSRSELFTADHAG
jgi:hypothetical protein